MDVKRKALQTLVTKLGSILKRTRSEALSELRIITKHDAESRPIDIEAGSNPYLAEILYSSSQDSQILLLQILSQFICFVKGESLSLRAGTGFRSEFNHISCI